MQTLIRENDNLRQCLRDMNTQISKKVDREKDNIFLKNKNLQGLSKKTKEEQIEMQLILLEREYNNNNFIFSQQERELRQLDEKMDNMAGNQQYTLVGQIELLQSQIRQEQMEVKQSKLMNFREGKYLDNALGNDQGRPKVVEEQQNKMMEVMKMQFTNDKLKETIKKRDEVMIEYAKKISMIDEDYQKALRQQRLVVPIDVALQEAIQEQKKKTDAQEDNLEIIAKNQEREMVRIQNVINELKLIEKQTDDSINEKEMQIRQLNVNLEQLRALAKEANPNALKQLEQHNDDIFDNNQLHQDVQAAIESSKVLNKQIEVNGKVEISRRHQSKDVLEKGAHISMKNPRSRQNLSNPQNGSQIGGGKSPLEISRLSSQQQFSEVKPQMGQKKSNGEQHLNGRIANGEKQRKVDENDFEQFQDNINNSSISPILQQKKQVIKQSELMQAKQVEERRNSGSNNSLLNDAELLQNQNDDDNDNNGDQKKGVGKMMKQTSQESGQVKKINLVEQKQQQPQQQSMIKQNNPVKITSDAQTEMDPNQPQKIIIPNKNRTTIQSNGNNNYNNSEDNGQNKSKKVQNDNNNNNNNGQQQQQQVDGVFALTKLPVQEQNEQESKIMQKPSKTTTLAGITNQNGNIAVKKKPEDFFEEIE